MTQATSIKPIVKDQTCLNCPHFNNYHEPNGRGWCELFNRTARTYHFITPDCISSSDLITHEEKEPSNFITADFSEAFPTEELVDEVDKPYSEYSIGSIVKVIDREKHHSEWGVFEVVECSYNKNLYFDSKTYLSQPEWYYRLASHNDSTTISKSLWVREDEICAFYFAHNVCTEEIF